MESVDYENAIRRVPNDAPTNEDRAVLAALVVTGAVFVALLHIFGFSRGEFLLPSLFLTLFVVLAVGQVYGHRRRRPTWVEFLDYEMRLSYPSGTTRSIPWHTIASVEIGSFLGDVHANVRYADGRMEDKAHIYGEAARELKRRFEARRTS